MENIILVQDLAVGYNKKNPILHHINFGINKGEFVGVIGRNGAGKSTLLKTLRGFLLPEQGTVQLFGKKVEEYQQRQLARKVAYLQQQVEMTFDYTAKDIVQAGRYPYKKWWQQNTQEDETVIQASMEYAGVWELGDKPIRSLSGGQKQRVLLSKVLAQQTPVLFLDEPAAGLDLFYQEEIFRFCQELCKRGKTVVMVVHELNLAARYCTRLLLMNEGSILADGSPQQVLTDSLLSRSYDAPIKSMTNPETGHADIFIADLDKENSKNKLLDIIIGETEKGL